MLAPSDDLVALLVPRVATPRLLLRGFRKGDLDVLAASFGDPESAQFVGGVVDRRGAWRLLAIGVGLWTLTGTGWWAVEEVATGELVGTVGAFVRETPSEWIELGWTVVRSRWGQGIASEAARAAASFAFERHAIPRVVAHIDARNTASVRVSEHLGMQYEGEVDLYDQPTGRYSLARSAHGA
ncbi:MAG: GNAT family N-acetyltransferase [Myxococcales bacterium]|nr:GNAT family N-acetyltransferase [Myxococcales bacterium]